MPARKPKCYGCLLPKTINKSGFCRRCQGMLNKAIQKTPTPPTFRYERLHTFAEVRQAIQDCEGRHTQQVAYSTFHDTMTQICWTEHVIRGTLSR